MRYSSPKRLGTILLASGAIALSACSGKQEPSVVKNRSDPPAQMPAPVVLPVTTMSDVFDGSFTDTAQPVTALLQDDGSYYLVYSGNGQAPAGAIVGSATRTNGGYASADAADLSLIGTGSQTPAPATLNGSIMAGKSFSGMVTYSSARGAIAFSTTYNDAYTRMPPLSLLAGTYAGAIATRSLKEDQLELAISASGAVSSKLRCGCNVTATLAPRSDGAAYIVTLQFVGGTHPLSNKSMAGNVYFDAARKRVYIVGNVNGTENALFVGTRVR
ncbi:MAG TPA: hypothetical protein VEC06_21410 [Paucimonas sp.]|nr:hypothetical protein [Paucimonas sp.]